VLLLRGGLSLRIRITLAGIAGCLLSSTPARSQDPLLTLPDAYKLGFENEHVRVVRVRYEPHARLPAHDHPKGPTAYVYLNDGGEVVFKHIGLAYGEIRRPATVTGGVRLAKAVEEIHEVENPNDSPSEFLRVEFKDLPPEEARIRGRFLPEPLSSTGNVSKVLFENGGLLIQRRTCVRAIPCDLGAEGSPPLLLVALGSGRLKPPAADPVPFAAGDSRWVSAGTQWVVENQGDTALAFLTFAFKTSR